MRSTAPGALEKDRHHGCQSQGLRSAPPSPRSPPPTGPSPSNRPPSSARPQGQAERVAEKFGLTAPRLPGHPRAARPRPPRHGRTASPAPSTTRRPRCTSSASSAPWSPQPSAPAASTPRRSPKPAPPQPAPPTAAKSPTPPSASSSRALRVAEFAADMAMQAFALLAAAHGAVEAFKEITGDDWVAYQAHDDAQGAPPAALAQDPALGLRRQLSNPRRGPSGPAPLAVHPRRRISIPSTARLTPAQRLSTRRSLAVRTDPVISPRTPSPGQSAHSSPPNLTQLESSNSPISTPQSSPPNRRRFPHSRLLAIEERPRLTPHILESLALTPTRPPASGPQSRQTLSQLNPAPASLVQTPGQDQRAAPVTPPHTTSIASSSTTVATTRRS